MYIINSKKVRKTLNSRTNTYPVARPPSIDPSLLFKSVYGFFMGYYNSTKVLFYLYSKTLCTNKTFHFYIDEYDIKLCPKEYMSFVDLMLQDYFSGVYQPSPQKYDPNILLIQPFLDILD